MTSLANLQQLFQDALIAGSTRLIDEIPDGFNNDREQMLAIYQNAYRARLIEMLGNDYPQLHALLGDSQFYELARSYIDAQPSRFFNARWFGSALSQFLHANAPWSENRILYEMALLEGNLCDVFDERDEVSLTLQELGQFEIDRWPQLVFQPIAATRRLRLSTNATTIWCQLRDEQEPENVTKLEKPQSVLIYRGDFQSHFRRLTDEEAMMWDEMSKGTRFAVLCELVATYGGEEDASLRAAGYLQTWIADGLINAAVREQSVT